MNATLLAALAGALALAVSFGEQPLSLARALQEPDSLDATLFWRLRLPRAALGALVGAALAGSGSALQALLRNPLADPFILGVSGGAALGATLALALGASVVADVLPLLPGGLGALSAPSLLAFVGAAAATLLVVAASRLAGRGGPHTALLTGVIFNAFAAAAITLLKTLSAPEKMGDILYWLAGTLGYERTGTLVLAACAQVLALGVLVVLSGRLNLLSLGDEDAASLGVRVARTRLMLLLAASVSVAGAVALSGLIGFVGLVVPHVLRLLLGPDQRLLLPASILGGAAFLVLADLAARLLSPSVGAELPVGVLTALMGGPFFLLLLYRRSPATAL
ncbi:MAG: iron ABC transporter permease [Myxococcaceae bacterium]|nr:iron ABC transporter permease [Myxococcaceae bacterium]